MTPFRRVSMTLDGVCGVSAKSSSSHANGHRGSRVARISLILACVVIIVSVLVGSTIVLLLTNAERDVRSEFAAIEERSIGVQLDHIWLSGSHLIGFSYNVSGGGELSQAVWYLVPYGEVVLSK